jgi:hypothetical protein
VAIPDREGRPLDAAGSSADAARRVRRHRAGATASAHPVRPGREAHLVAYPSDES